MVLLKGRRRRNVRNDKTRIVTDNAQCLPSKGNSGEADKDAKTHHQVHDQTRYEPKEKKHDQGKGQGHERHVDQLEPAQLDVGDGVAEEVVDPAGVDKLARDRLGILGRDTSRKNWSSM